MACRLLYMFALLAMSLVLYGCPEDSPEQADDTGGGANNPACPGQWQDAGAGVWLQPGACLGWSPSSAAAMSWYEAVSPEAAAAGGCLAYCDDEPGYCSALGSLGGVDGWRLPAAIELQEAGFASPPLQPLDGYLWSRDSDATMENLALQVELEAPEVTFLAGKDQEGLVRCVANL